MLRNAVAAALIILAPLAAEWSGTLRPVEHELDALHMAVAPRAPTGKLVIVDIDAKSIAAIGTWPWPRRVYGNLIDRLRGLGVSQIAFDVDFSALSNEADDAAFEAALKRAGGSVILAAFVQKLTAGADAVPVYNRPLDRFASNAWMASVTVRQDSDGLVRRSPYGIITDGQVVPSMPALLAGGLAQPGRDFGIDFSIDVSAIDRISLIDVLDGAVAPVRLAGKTVIVGAQAVELRDFFAVPNAGTISGALLQAAATETLMQHRALEPTNLGVALAGLLLIGLAAFLAIGRARWWLAIASLMAAGLIVEAVAAYVQARYALVVSTAPWHLALAVYAVIVLVSEIDFGVLLERMWRARASNAEALLGQVVADNFAGVVVVDKEGLIRAASRSASTLLGWPNALAGLNARTALPGEFASSIEAVLTVPGYDRCTRHPVVFDFRRASGERRIFEYIVTVSEVDNETAGADGAPGRYKVACLTFTDVTEQRTSEVRIERMARFDSLTELPNRNQLIERLEAAFTSDKTAVRASAIVCFDLDGFKNVNDTLGHNIGDLLLRTVAARSAALLPADAMLARLGGDEFAAVFSGQSVRSEALEFATRVIAVAGQPFQLSGHQVIVSASAGVALADSRDKGADDVLKRADVALHRAKSNGGNGYTVFDRSMLQSIVERQRMEFDLWQALERGEFEVWYQPQIDLEDDRLVGVEALLRWRHPERGIVSPAEFVPVAEAIGMIHVLGRWVLDTACRQVANWPGDIRLAVNVSSVQFVRSDMAEVVSEVLASSGLPAGQLDIEITESLFIQPGEKVLETLSKVRALGVGVALDDFGTGYSSLSYIQRFPITKIKLDRSFVADLPVNADSAAIVRAVASLARDLRLRLNAEGVENATQAAFLRQVGVAEVQGYLYGVPQPAADLVRLLERQMENGRRLRA